MMTMRKIHDDDEHGSDDDDYDYDDGDDSLVERTSS